MQANGIEDKSGTPAPDSDSAREALQFIAEELAELVTGAAHLRDLYGDYAESSDLTFIKILEERYGLLVREIRDIREIIAQVQADYTHLPEEAGTHGR